MFRPVHHLFAKIRAAKARREAREHIAGQTLNAHRLAGEDAKRQALIDRLCGELGKPSIKLARRG